MRTGRLVFLCLLVAAGVSLARYSDNELKMLYKSYMDGAQLTREEYHELRQAQLVGGSSHPVIDHLGGPDAFGYIFKDSDEPDGPTYNWIDITGTGTEVSENGDIQDDDFIGPYPIGFNFPFYGTNRSQFYIHSNGVISFTQWPFPASSMNTAFPGNGLGGAAICPFWDDLDPWHDLFNSYDGGQIYYETRLVGGHNALVVSFVDVMQYPGSPTQDALITFQTILFEDGTIRFQYNDISNTFQVNSSAETIGLINDNQDIYLETSLFDSPLDYPFVGLAIEYTTLEANANLSGSVRESGTYVPIPGATVQIGNNVTTTDADGLYSFTNIFSGISNYEVSAPWYQTSTGSITLQPGQNARDFVLDEYQAPADILVVDVDETIDSGAEIDLILNDLGYTTYYTNSFFELPFIGFQAVFVCVGVWPNDFLIATNSEEEQACIGYLNAGGNFYLEGADVYAFAAPDNLIPMLNLTGLADGSGDLSTVAGEDTLSGLSMSYAGENSYIDHIEPGLGATRILYNPSDNAGCGVIDNSQDYNTACFTFELGMLTDTQDYTRAMILETVMNNFNVDLTPDLLAVELTGRIVTIPPGGGTVIYDAYIYSTIPAPVFMDVWTTVMIPNGNVVGPLVNINYMVVPGTEVELGLPQPVPGMAPGGSYIYSMYMGNLPSPILASDSFTFVKLETDPDGGGSWYDPSWATLLADKTGSQSVTLPTEYTMDAAYPNPFNPTTAITIDLPDAAELRVVAYNLAGQVVGTLADGSFNAGTHTLTFDGSGLAAGMYFIHAMVPGELDSVQKVVLVK